MREKTECTARCPAKVPVCVSKAHPRSNSVCAAQRQKCEKIFCRACVWGERRWPDGDGGERLRRGARAARRAVYGHAVSDQLFDVRRRGGRSPGASGSNGEAAASARRLRPTADGIKFYPPDDNVVFLCYNGDNTVQTERKMQNGTARRKTLSENPRAV